MFYISNLLLISTIALATYSTYTIQLKETGDVPSKKRTENNGGEVYEHKMVSNLIENSNLREVEGPITRPYETPQEQALKANEIADVRCGPTHPNETYLNLCD